MGDYIKAAQLDSSHIGKTVRVALGKAQAEDILVGVTHNSAMAETTSIFVGETRYEPGRMQTTLIFQQLGEVKCSPSQKVAVVD